MKTNSVVRCPRCGGFMCDASQWYYKWRYAYKNCLHCINCGRNWRVYLQKGKVELEYYSRPIVSQRKEVKVA